MTSRLATAFLCSLVTLLGSASARMNVLFIAVDDLRPELGCYGVGHAPSPHIDQFAKGGVVFRNHFVQVPTCGASRYALLTGRSPARSGALGNEALYRGKTALTEGAQPGAQSMPELFRKNGYHTTLIGKISHTADGRVYAYDGSGDGRPEIPHAWDDFATPLGSWGRGWGIFFAYTGGRSREDGGGHHDLMEFVAENDSDLPDGLLAETAIARLRDHRPGDKPFFMGLGFIKPHLPFVATKGDWDAVAEREVPAPPHPGKPESPFWHESGEFFKYAFPEGTGDRPLADEDIALFRRAYLACVRYTDRQVGKVLDALEDSGLADSTVVVLWGDHGWNLGDSAMWAKHTPFERALRSPLIIRAPGIGTHGTVSDALVETTDLYPTLLDLCGPFDQQETAFPLDGTSLRPVLENPGAEVHEAALSYWKGAVSVRTKDYRLILPAGGGTDGSELYDASTGFDPVRNLAPENPETVRRLRALVPRL